MAEDERGAGIELADTPEVKEAADMALEAIKGCYYEPGDWLEQSANRDAAHIIALAIAAGQFKANQRAEKAERALAGVGEQVDALARAYAVDRDSVDLGSAMWDERNETLLDLRALSRMAKS